MARELWFESLPAVMRVRITTPNVLIALRRRDPGAAKPYNFALSPILLKPPPACTLIGPANKHSEEWLTQDYTEIYSGETVNLATTFNGTMLSPQTISEVIWRHFLHPEDKSLAPDGGPCEPYTRGLLLRRPVTAMSPFVYIGKEIERRAQEGEEVSVLENAGPLRYYRSQTVNTQPCSPQLLKRLKGFSLRQLEGSGLSRDTIIQARRGERVHPSTRLKLERAVGQLE